MRFTRSRISDAKLPYAISVLRILGRDRVVMASEGPGPALVLDDDLAPRVLANGQGGSMGSAPYPGRDDHLFMVTGFLPVFQSEGAGIDLCRASDGLSAPWSQQRIIDLPFVHRIATASCGGASILIAATVCGGKEYRDDWSKPGAVYAIPIPASPEGPWKPVTIADGIHRNHGLTIASLDGERLLLVTGDEGVLAWRDPAPDLADAGVDGLARPDRVVSATELTNWKPERILDARISEIGVIDIDGDGADELVAVEPFHGDSLALYHQSVDGWSCVDRQPLDFGHGLSVGMLGDTPVAVVGNRAGSSDLLCFTWDSDRKLLARHVVESGVGTAGTTVFSGFIVASNSDTNEYVRYDLEASE